MTKKNYQLKYYNINNFETIPQLQALSDDQKHTMRVISHVLPFRTNNYVINELIDWNNIPEDPMFQLAFMQHEFLSKKQFNQVASAIHQTNYPDKLKRVIHKVRAQLNPHPAEQLVHNVPLLAGTPVPGLQHKYRETALIFPTAGQTCFTYCTFCFRWPQFIGEKQLKFATDQSQLFFQYLKHHKEITDVLITGGDPMIMSARHLDKLISPLLSNDYKHIQNIRIGSKVLSFWPYRFITDQDADQYLYIFEKVNKSGKHLAFMAHFNHWRELETEATQEAVQRILTTGTSIRCQSPLLRKINDDPNIWQQMWQTQVKLGMIPYYMFVERDTGPKSYYEIPLVKAYEIFRQAYQKTSGLARTVRGPSMSAAPGKITVEGIEEIAGEKVIQLKFLQSRNPEWCNKIFYAKYNDKACWLSDLVPAFGKQVFFFEAELLKSTVNSVNNKDNIDVTPVSLSY
ncbi:KamA family radical SAM protein [Spartinivicinus poritis]|uniref:Lysine 2,3-aminomutase n=1 Tax=Spartinivicinus poritis TaxID=2994640 RepID=A0ABT5U930_9GAMM|nr:lysine 2,3-aminomutase [Spartinivicinus sp. A2-2]MDE1461639.1 lysine 2,3-aminomutase [Spartinivicinus sp. A2-2]